MPVKNFESHVSHSLAADFVSAVLSGLLRSRVPEQVLCELKNMAERAFISFL